MSAAPRLPELLPELCGPGGCERPEPGPGTQGMALGVVVGKTRWFGWVGLVGLGWVGLGWVGLGWVGLGWLGWLSWLGWLGWLVGLSHRVDLAKRKGLTLKLLGQASKLRRWVWGRPQGFWSRILDFFYKPPTWEPNPNVT